MRASDARRMNEEKMTWNTLIANMFLDIALYFYLREVYACIKFFAQHGAKEVRHHGRFTNFFGNMSIIHLRRKGFEVNWVEEDNINYLVVSWPEEMENQE